MRTLTKENQGWCSSATWWSMLQGAVVLLKWPCDCVRLQFSGRRERRRGFRWITLSLIPACVFPRRRSGGCPPRGTLLAAGSRPSWGRDGVVAMKWNSVEVSICWLQRAFLVVRGSGGRKERQDKNKAAVLYLAINHFGIFYFFFPVVFEDYAISKLVHEFFILYHYCLEELSVLLWHFYSSESQCLGGEEGCKFSVPM